MLIDVSAIFTHLLLGANLPVLESEEVSARLLENPRESWEGVFRGTGEPRGIFRELLKGLWPVLPGFDLRGREPEVRAVQYLSLNEAFGNGGGSVDFSTVSRDDENDNNFKSYAFSYDYSVPGLNSQDALINLRILQCICIVFALQIRPN